MSIITLILRLLHDVYIVSGEGAHTLTKTNAKGTSQNFRIHGGIYYEYGS